MIFPCTLTSQIAPSTLEENILEGAFSPLPCQKSYFFSVNTVSFLSQVIQRWQVLVFPHISTSTPMRGSQDPSTLCQYLPVLEYLFYSMSPNPRLFKLCSWHTPIKRIRNERVWKAQDPYGMLLKIYFRQWPIFYAFSIGGSFDSVRVISSVWWRAPDWKISLFL